MTTNRQEKLETGNVWNVIASLAIPTVIITLIMVIYNMADVFFIGKTNNVDMVNAIAVCMPIFTIVQSFATLIGAGGCTAISIALGRDEKKQCYQISSFCFYFSITLGIIIIIGLNIFADPIVTMLGAADSYKHYAIMYLRVLATGCPVMLFSNAFVNLMRADGSMKEPMIANLTGTIVNIILDPIFIIGFNYGVVGAGIATVIGNAVASVLVIIMLPKKKHYISINPKHLTFKPDVTIKPLLLGLPLASGTLVQSVSYMLMNNLLLSVNANAQGAFGISRSIMLLSTTVQLGICMGVQPAVSYNYGKNNAKRVKEFIIKTSIVCMGFGLLVALVCIGGRDLILDAFIKDDGIRKYGAPMVVGFMITAPVYSIFQSCVTALQATDRPISSTVVTLLRQGIILMPAMLILYQLGGFNWLVFCFAVTDIIAALVGVVLLKKSGNV